MIDINDYSLGAIKDKKDRRDYRIAGIQETIKLPDKFELEEKFTSKNQDGRGSCTAQAQAHHKERQEGVALSARFIFAKTKELENNKNYGAYTRNAFKIVKEVGACEEDLYPEPGSEMSYDKYLNWNTPKQEHYDNAKKYKSDSYWRVESDIESIKQAIYKNKNSVIISVPWYKSDNNVHNGYMVSAPNKEEYIGGHAVEVCGWTTNYLKLKNSWGLDWGRDGYGYYPIKREIWDAWTSLDLPKELLVDKRYGFKRTWKSYVLEGLLVAYWTPQLKRLPSTREISAGVYGRWDADAIFFGRVGDKWLFQTKMEYNEKTLNGLTK